MAVVFRNSFCVALSTTNYIEFMLLKQIDDKSGMLFPLQVFVQRYRPTRQYKYGNVLYCQFVIISLYFV